MAASGETRPPVHSLVGTRSTAVNKVSGNRKACGRRPRAMRIKNGGRSGRCRTHLEHVRNERVNLPLPLRIRERTGVDRPSAVRPRDRSRRHCLRARLRRRWLGVAPETSPRRALRTVRSRLCRSVRRRDQRLPRLVTRRRSRPASARLPQRSDGRRLRHASRAAGAAAPRCRRAKGRDQRGSCMDRPGRVRAGASDRARVAIGGSR